MLGTGQLDVLVRCSKIMYFLRDGQRNRSIIWNFKDHSPGPLLTVGWRTGATDDRLSECHIASTTIPFDTG